MVTELSGRLLLSLLKRWPRIPFAGWKVGALAGLMMGFIGVFDLARDLMTGLLVSHLLVTSNFVVVALNHFFPEQGSPGR